jgi:hypothetical protein
VVALTTPEGAVQHAVLDYLARLELQGKLIFWRQNNTGVWDARKGCYRKPKGPGSRLGVPDIMVIMPPNGLLVAIECKAPKGTQSDPQKGFQRALEKVGGRYFVVRSVDDVRAALSDCSKNACTSATE